MAFLVEFKSRILYGRDPLALLRKEVSKPSRTACSSDFPETYPQPQQKSRSSSNPRSDGMGCAGVVFEDKAHGCHAPVLFDTKKKELIFTPIYYYIGHFSKFVQRGALRVATTKYCEQIYAIAFKNPDGSLVTVLMNVADSALPVVLRREDVCTEFKMEPHSIATVLL